MKVLILTRFGKQGASSRMRTFLYLPSLVSSNIDYEISPLFDDKLLLKKYQIGSYPLKDLFNTYCWRISALLRRFDFDIIWIEKEALPWLPLWFEKALLLGRPYILDFDDALFHKYDQHSSSWIRYFYGRRIDKLMEQASLVVAGNRSTAAAAGAKKVEIIPTVIDLLKYIPKQIYVFDKKPIIVWIGSPSTVQYLMELTEPLIALAKLRPFTLRVIGGVIAIPDVDVDYLPWTEETEATLIAECDIGIMPLKNTLWEQGKCAYKLIQYMACGLPTVSFWLRR